MKRLILILVIALGGGLAGRAAETELPSPLAVLAQQAPNVSAWVLSPLEQTVPNDIRQSLTLLREGLLDEAKTRPGVGTEAYRTGHQLCGTMIAALDERSQALVRAGVVLTDADARTGLTNQALDARRNHQMSWPQFERERDQRDELKSQAVNKAAVLKERPKVEWANRTAQIRVVLDGVYAKFREALRQNPALAQGASASASASAAASPVASTPPLTAPAPTAAASTPAANGSGSDKEAVVQVVAGTKAASGATIIVTKTDAQGEEQLVVEGKSEEGKVAFPVEAGVKYNVYASLEGHDFFMKKNCAAANLPQVVLRPLAPGKTVSLGQKGTGVALLGGEVTDIVPVRANQGSPVFEWLFRAGESAATVDGGRKATNGEFWLKEGEPFRIVGPNNKKTSMKFITSIARKYVVFETR